MRKSAKSETHGATADEKPLIDYANPQSEPAEDLVHKRSLDRIEFWSTLLVFGFWAAAIGGVAVFVIRAR